MSGTYPSQKDVIDKEGFNIFAKLGNHPDLKGVPDLRDAMQGEYRTLAKILATPLLAGRPFITAPGTPPDVVAVLREAFRKTVQDPDYIRELNQAGEEVGYTSPEELEDLYREILNAPDNIVALFDEKK